MRVTHHGHAVVEQRLAEDEEVEIGVDPDLGEDGEHSHRVHWGQHVCSGLGTDGQKNYFCTISISISISNIKVLFLPFGQPRIEIVSHSN